MNVSTKLKVVGKLIASFMTTVFFFFMEFYYYFRHYCYYFVSFQCWCQAYRNDDFAAAVNTNNGIERQNDSLKVAPYSFLTVRELVSKSHDRASFKKSTRKSRATRVTCTVRILATIVAHFQCVSHP